MTSQTKRYCFQRPAGRLSAAHGLGLVEFAAALVISAGLAYAQTSTGAQFNNPDVNASNRSFGTISSAANGRNVQLGLKLNF